MTPASQARTPVRSAPLRRRRTPSKPDEAPQVEAPKVEAPPAESAPTPPATPEQPSPAVNLTTPERTGPVADPDELVSSLSYRERRQRRMAAAPGGDDAAPVTKVSALRARSDRSILAWVATGLAVIVIVGCLVASSVFAIALGRIDHQRNLRAEYSSFAQLMTVTMTSLNPGNVDAAMKTMADKTSGTAQQRLNESMGQAVSLIRDQKLDVQSTVISDAVTKADDDEGTVIVVYGWQMKPTDPKEQTIVQTFRWRVDITRINGELKMTDFEWVT
ncbi:hypothetical protein QNM97_01295 [Gordonia sp. L191]|uniref:hypothetical protein n=1 Tax=Gordonia sp. L191 TaxID=2982699 RepID=UPI0024C0902F|nr:hypothetical protein [Gordonia sp. L191]WHU47685.1 hypothetical protein QNM97_01295 [Gordonia sp. L191]